MAKKKGAARKKAKSARGILQKKKSAPPQKTKKPGKGAGPHPQAIRQETFELYFGGKAPPHHFAQQRMAPEEEILGMPDLPKPEALKTIEHKKRIPHAVTAVLAGAILALFSLFVFYAVLYAGDFLSFSLSAAIFVGFSIFLYGRLEKG